jgi:myo-inositol-1(or 4)-monophosphatase
MFRDELAALRGLALRAGAFLLERFEDIESIDPKAGRELVTDVDRRCEDLVLAGMRELFPGEVVEAEEGGKTAGDGGRTWYVDPVDGTTNLVHGYSHFCVSIGCADLAAVHAPYLDELYLAARGEGAVFERPGRGERRTLPRRGPVEIADALLATGFPYIRDRRVDRNTELVRRMLHAQCHGVRRAGSAAIDLCHVGAGKLDGYWEMGLRPWDVAAGALVAREAGCLVSDFAGAAVALPGESIVAAAPGLHRQLLAIIAEVP